MKRSAKYFLGHLFRQSNQAPPTRHFLSPSMLESYSGWYRNQKTDAGMRLYQKDGKLFSTSRNSVLLKASESKYYLADNEVVFSDKGLTLINSAREAVNYEKRPDTNTTSELAAFTGEFESQEAEAYWKISLREGKLIVWQRPGREFDLQPSYRDGFDSAVGSLFFLRDKKKKITGFRMSTWRARGVLFNKIQKKNKHLLKHKY